MSGVTHLPDSRRIRTRVQHIQFGAGCFELLEDAICTLVIATTMDILITALFLPMLRVCKASVSPALARKRVIMSVGRGRCAENSVVTLCCSGGILIGEVVKINSSIVRLASRNAFVVGNRRLIRSCVDGGTCNSLASVRFPFAMPGGACFIINSRHRADVSDQDARVKYIRPDRMIKEVIFSV